MVRIRLFEGVLPAVAFIAAAGVSIIPQSGASAQTPHVIISSANAEIVVAPGEPEPVVRAAKDLQNDFTKVFGGSPKIANDLNAAGPVVLLIAQAQNVPSGVSCAKSSDRESFAFSLAGAGVGPTRRRVVCLVGADMRGTIYAIYEFSQRVLGMDPMYLWTDKQPAKHASISLPADFTRSYPSPIFKYRGFFINDEDLLTGWVTPKKGEQTGIALSTWDMVFETILRLKGNMVAPGSWIFPDDAQVHAAAERGLIVNQHHATPLGMNAARWPRDVPYNYSTHPEVLERAWTNAVNSYKPGEEILWTVGLRGLSDQSYAQLDPSVRGNDPLLGQRISEAVAEQMKIVRAKYPDAHFITNLWMEGDRLMQEGYLKIPPEVSLVWSDTGYGDVQDGGKVAAGQGMYFHVAMLNGDANQLSELVSPRIIQSEIGRFINAGATAYLLVNTSDIRPVAMTARAVMEMAHGGVPETTGGADGDADTAYYRKWASEEFGAKSAGAVTRVYREYFAAPAPHTPFGPPRLTSAGVAPPSPPKYSNVPLFNGDQHYHDEARRILHDYLSQHQVFHLPNQSPKWTEARVIAPPAAEQRALLLDRDIKDSTDARPRWDGVWKDAVAAESLIDPTRRNYYQEAVLTMITINRESNRMLGDVAQSLKDVDAGDNAKAQSEAADALKSLDEALASMHTAEYGKWKHWYRGDWLTGIYRTRELIAAYAQQLKDPLAKVPPPIEWNGWEGYFHIMQYEGDRSVDVN